MALDLIALSSGDQKSQLIYDVAMLASFEGGVAPGSMAMAFGAGQVHHKPSMTSVHAPPPASSSSLLMIFGVTGSKKRHPVGEPQPSSLQAFLLVGTAMYKYPIL